MPPVKTKSECGPRARLRGAIEAAEAAEAAVRDLEIAETASFERKMEAEDRLEALKESHERQADGAADAFIASMATGVDLDVLEAPSKQRAAEIAEARRAVAVLARVRDEIAERIPVARQAADDAKKKVESCAKAVLAEKLDPERLIAAHDAAYRQLVDARARLRFVESLLPHPENLPIYHLLRARSRNESPHDDCRRDPANAVWVACLEKLQQDAETPLPDLAP
jgi:hypothetical protein